MAVASSFIIIIVVIIALIFFSLNPPPAPSRRSLLLTTSSSCSNESNGLLNYHCIFPQTSSFSIPSLSLFLLLHFYILITTAQHHFSLVTTKLTSHLNLFPSMDTVMFLSLGNSTLDIFPLIALRADQCRIGFGAILSTGTFVSAVVIGFVTVYVVPFVVYPLPFVREVLFYLTTATFLFYVYLSVEIFLW